MSYIVHSLGRTETLLYRGHFPSVYRAGGWGVIAIAVLGAVLAAAGGHGWLAAVVFIGGLLCFLAIMMPIWTTEIGVTNQRFIFKRGLLWRSTQELQLRAIEEVNLIQGVLGRLFDYGRIDIRGTGVGDICLPAIADPIGLRKALQDGIAAAAPAASTSPSLPAR
jgi:uncharacterized membrane protein YdbT with pleckstrin-like domain